LIFKVENRSAHDNKNGNNINYRQFYAKASHL
jgi:hypothetical protein